MDIELLSITENAEELIEKAGRVCYDSKAKNPESKNTFIQSIIKRGHLSVIEHASATFKISGISRACSHQLVRHRLVVHSMRSQRYVKEGEFDYVIPQYICENPSLLKIYNDFMESSQATYDILLNGGAKPEDARFVLPNACTTITVMTANFREWRHIIELRISKKSQWEIRNLMLKILFTLNEYAPNVFRDLIVGS